MTRLDDVQERLLRTAQETFDEVLPVLQSMKEQYEYAEYRAKKPLRDVVDNALAGGVPLKRIAEAAGYVYPQQLKKWLHASPELAERMLNDPSLAAVEAYNNEIESIESVSRDPRTGVIDVTYQGKSYQVKALGPDEEMWSTREDGIPEGAYALIKDKYPTYEVLEDED